MDKVTLHLEKEGQSTCRHSERQEEQHASLRLSYEGLVIFAPSPELRERMQQVAEGGNAGRAKGDGDSGRDRDQGGSAGGGNDRREDGDRSSSDTGSGSHGDGGDGDSGDSSDENGENGGDGISGDEDDGDGEIPLEEGEVVAPQEDIAGPSVSLAGISASGVGQEVVDHHGSLMQTCRPGGTPTTYSVWVAASDPSGVYRLLLSSEHPTDGTYESSTGVADGDAVRFDVPAYRTGPKALETVQVRLTARAKDANGNRTDAGLGTLPLYECGEPG
ncbi:hypothetical protein [Streptomyces chartreusis]|uniref:hypothetical protein n=1 Tax=Streptomyces chartreusis TaxID=1969 RepID=UPI00364FF102